MLAHIYNYYLPLHLPFIQLLFTRKAKGFALYEGAFYCGYYAPALYFTDAVSKCNMKEGTVLSILHQHHQQLVCC
jgi:hypothetical protein